MRLRAARAPLILIFMARADCPICQGSGWKVVERSAEGAQAVASGETSRPGAAAGEPKMVWAVPCDCTMGDKTERVLARARVPERYRHCDFDNFETDNEYGEVSASRVKVWNQSLAQAKVAVQGFVREFPLSTEHGFLLMGPCGVGKTHLAVAALKEIVARGHGGLFYEYQRLLKEIQDSYNAASESTEMSVLEPVLKAEILVLDDVGSSKPSPWVVETVGHILNSRYNDRRFTLITTNYVDPEFRKLADCPPPRESGTALRDSSADARPTHVVKLPSGETIAVKKEETFEDRVGRRIRSRLYEMCRTVEMSAPDYRKEIRDAGRFRA